MVNTSPIQILGVSPLEFIITLLILCAYIGGLWKIFEKAGEKGWKSIIPIYNIYIFFKIVNIPPWAIVLLIIPVVGGLLALYAHFKFANAFNKGLAFGFLVVLFPWIAFPLLGFGSYTYDDKYRYTTRDSVEKELTHRCKSCGEEYYTVPSTEISTCEKCGGIKIESLK
jgi:hypothetical protein